MYIVVDTSNSKVDSVYRELRDACVYVGARRHMLIVNADTYAELHSLTMPQAILLLVRMRKRPLGMFEQHISSVYSALIEEVKSSAEVLKVEASSVGCIGGEAFELKSKRRHREGTDAQVIWSTLNVIIDSVGAASWVDVTNMTIAQVSHLNASEKTIRARINEYRRQYEKEYPKGHEAPKLP